MSELGQTSDPVDLIPGSVSGLDEFVSRWRENARTAGDIAAQLTSLPSPEGWEGAAADGFAARLPDVGTQWQQLGESLTTAADALDEYATVLGWAQQKAGDAIAMWQVAQAQTAAGVESYRQAERQAGATGIVPFYTDAGAATRSDAQSLLAYARSEVRDAGDTAAHAVTAITPPEALTWEGAGALFLGALVVQGQIHWDTLANLVNGTASVGNAILRNPDALLALLGGGAMMIGGGATALGGGGLAATGVGSVPGGAAVVGGVAVAGTGGALAAAGASKLAGEATGSAGVMLMEKQHGADRGDGRDDYGQFAHGQTNKPWVDKEKIGLDEVEAELKVPVERQRARSSIEGSTQQRYFDGYVKNDDGTYTAIEVKSGTGYEKYMKNAENQKSFDDSISPDNPATVTIRGQKMTITDVLISVVP
ncbi:hypothetical protein DEU35_1127 [Microbacterium sp. AG157]|uniref:Putative T7SS secretion signal domain-containing protein n=2 Tax=Microbacterium TaxID=33882 RepID=A0A4Y3QPN3_MICTE|nr:MULTISPECIES: hypothetical protein [Microbacterium]RED00147.1 hypothetical protein DEU35_1127 [Microbacterium sp. AG157]WJS91144.1 hypothetical protein NYQ11_00910 [Microbacterium testaceum]GEB47426.1 hypothetical protein MTE01_33710 [Microbacterium testaceum]